MFTTQSTPSSYSYQAIGSSFVKSAAPLDRPILGSELTDAAVTNGMKTLVCSLYYCLLENSSFPVGILSRQI